MSIPPLVCSTPPPPEQFEDEKDIEEFSTNFNLPLDDMDDSSFTYDHLTPDISCEKSLPTTALDYHKHYNSYKSSIPENVNHIEHLPNRDLYSCDAVNSECEKECGSLQLNGGTSRIDEDNNIEDLHLKVDIIPIDTDRGLEHVDDSFQEFSQTQNSKLCNTCEALSVKTIGDTPEPQSAILSNISPLESGIICQEVSSVNVSLKLENPSNSIPNENGNEVQSEHTQSCDELNLEDSRHWTLSNTEQNNTDIDVEHNIHPSPDFECKEESTNDDKFDAFQDFNAFNNCSPHTDGVEDTWAEAGIEDKLVIRSHLSTNSLDSDGDDFDTFQSVTQKDIVLKDCSKENTTVKTTELCDESNRTQIICGLEDDDDFGDFDAYQSTPSTIKESDTDAETVTNTHEAESIGKSATLNLQSGSSESILESIQESFNTLYPDKDGKDDDALCRTLASQLSECWGHLTDSETRQPYCRSWNSSAGQKALLKALGIDSRNILFGQKWNLGMPRYAVNLSASPLQPLQPSKPPGASILDGQHSIDKSATAKSAADWNLSQESQESRDKDVEETNDRKLMNDLPKEFNTGGVLQNGSPYPPSLSSHSSSSTSHLHPPTNLEFHQISLPDTHIFTPTDSETPRSQTIHYHTPTRDEILTIQITSTGTNIHQSLDLDDDFDDFQGSTPQDNVQKYVLEESVEVMKKDANVTEIVAQSSAGVYQSHSVLEPVKIEPTMPTLNWPEPGEIKETFDDFSEFVSHSDWGNVKTSFTPLSSLNPVSQYNSQTTKALSEEAPIKLEAAPVIPPVSHLPNGKTNVLNEFEGFTKPIFPLTKTKLEVNDSFAIDDFETFQSAEPEIPSLAPELSYTNYTNNFPSVPKSNVQNVTASPTLVPLKFQTGQTVLSPSKSSYFQAPQPNSLENRHPLPIEKRPQQILQPLSLESFSNSQINWPDPGIDIQQLSRFNPILSVHSLKNSTHNTNGTKELPADDDGWGDFVSMKPSTSQSPKHSKKNDDSEDWSDFVSNTGPKQVSNSVNTISFNVATNSSNSAQKMGNGSLKPRTQSRDVSEIPSLNYVTPKTNSRNQKSHFQNL